MKKYLTLLSALVLLISLVGCGAKEIDKNALEKEILETVSFESEQVLASETAVSTIFNLPKGVSATLYKGSAVYADSFCIFTFEEGTDIENLKEQVNNYFNKLSQDYSSYAPDEVPKLKDVAVAEGKNAYLYIISRDKENIEKVISNNF